MADFVFFTVTGRYEAVITDDVDIGADPDVGLVTGVVTFTPNVSTIPASNLSQAAVALLRPVTGRIVPQAISGNADSYADLPDDLDDGDAGVVYLVTDQGLLYEWSGTAWPADGQGRYRAGVLETADGHTGVRLLANTSAIGPIVPNLTYTVSYSRMRFDRGDRQLNSVTFIAPGADIALDMADVTITSPVKIDAASAMRGARGPITRWVAIEEGPPKVWQQYVEETDTYVGDPEIFFE